MLSRQPYLDHHKQNKYKPMQTQTANVFEQVKCQNVPRFLFQQSSKKLQCPT